MSIAAKIAVAAILFVASGTIAQASERGREQRIVMPASCGEVGQACANQLKEQVLFCISEDRCTALAPRPVAVLIRYDAKMDALR